MLTKGFIVEYGGYGRIGKSAFCDYHDKYWFRKQWSFYKYFKRWVRGCIKCWEHKCKELLISDPQIPYKRSPIGLDRWLSS